MASMVSLILFRFANMVGYGTGDVSNLVLNNLLVVFGKVLDATSMLTVRKCEAAPVNGSTPRVPLKIVECGEL